MISMPKDQDVTRAYDVAKETYARVGVDTDTAMAKLSDIPLSFHCWQADDVCGFEQKADISEGGIMATGGYPGRARNGDEVRADLDRAMRHIPGKKRVSVMTNYSEPEQKGLDWDEIGPEHFSRWVDWAKERGYGIDFLPTLYAHPKAADGFTLSNRDEGVRKFWVEVTVAGRKIAEHFAKELGSPSVCNIWIPDGMKDTPADRKTPRDLLKKSLDEAYAVNVDRDLVHDAMESKLFGLASESYVVGSHEFYLGYAAANDLYLCMDTGHFHPTEVVSDKISAVMPFVKGVFLHVSRGVRWDSDHVLILSDELRALGAEIIHGGYLDRTHLSLDFFDASINRVAAYVVGGQAMYKALLIALLDPIHLLQEAEASLDYTARLALFEQIKALPFGAVWDYYCLKEGILAGEWWLEDIRNYEKEVLSKRS